MAGSPAARTRSSTRITRGSWCYASLTISNPPPGSPSERGGHLAGPAAVDHRFLQIGFAIQHAAIHCRGCGNDLAVAPEDRVAEFENTQVRPSTRSHAHDRCKDVLRRTGRLRLGQD